MKSLRSRLLIAIGAIFLVAQIITILWLWQESRELIELYVARMVATPPIDPATFNADVRQEIVESLAALILPGLLTLVALFVSIYVAISYFTQPLYQLARQIESKSSWDLSPIRLTNATSELAIVDNSINQLLHRLEQSIENERRFTSDVAHELRTPLAGLRLNLELLEGESPATVDKLIARIDQMMASIEQLLQLARAGQKLLEGKAQCFDLIREVIVPLRSDWEEGIGTHCVIDWQTPPQLMMKGDSGLIYLLLRNLLDNVRCYASESRCVQVRVVPWPQQLTLEVIDEGPGVPEEKIPLLTQRFTRLDQSRKGHGLGLNIVRRIVMTHQGTLTIRNRTDRSGLHITVVLPR